MIFCVAMTGNWGCTVKKDFQSEAATLVSVDQSFAKRSVEKGAAEAFREYLLEDALQFSAGVSEPITGIAAIYENMKEGMDSTTVLSWEPRQAEVSASGDMGYTWGYLYGDEKNA